MEAKYSEKDYKLDKKEFKIICYAMIISENKDNLSKLLVRFERVANELNMVISAQKTKSLTISKEPRRCKLAIYNNHVEQVISFKYLGVDTTLKIIETLKDGGYTNNWVTTLKNETRNNKNIHLTNSL